MPEQPFPLNATTPSRFIRQSQQLFDDLYSNRLAGARVGDVFSLDQRNDVFTLQLSEPSGLQKISGGLAVLPLSTGCVTVGTNGVDVALASTTKKGACPILSDDDAEFLDGKGGWTNPLVDGISGTITLAKLTPAGAEGSITVVDGLITAFVNPT